MKKLMAVLAICAVAGYVAAQTVVSGNVVGYTTVALSNGLVNTGYVFQNLNSADGSWSLTNSIFSQSLIAGDSYYVFNPNTFDLDSYTYNGDGTWALYGSDGSTGTVVPVLKIGSGFIFQPQQPTLNYIQAGQVPTNGTYTTSFPASSLVMFSSNVPVDLKVSDFLAFVNDGDSIYVFNPNTFDLDSYTFSIGSQNASLYGSDGTTATLGPTSVVLPLGGVAIYQNGGNTVTLSQTINL